LGVPSVGLAAVEAKINPWKKNSIRTREMEKVQETSFTLKETGAVETFPNSSLACSLKLNGFPAMATMGPAISKEVCSGAGFDATTSTSFGDPVSI
jgi:hypothetical protein